MNVAPLARSLRALRDPFVAITALGVVANLAIIWGFAHVAAQDHANHVASLRVLRGLWESDPFFVARFRVSHRIVPDLLSELVWFAALRPFGEVFAGKALLSLYALGLPAAWRAFTRRFCEGDETLLPLAPLVTMSLYYSLGSTNFLLGMPCFLAACVAWDAVRERPRALLSLALWSAATWLAHLYDYLFLLTFVGAHVIALGTSKGLPARRELAGLAGLSLGLAAAVAAVLTREGEWSQSAPPRFDHSLRALAQLFDEALFLRGHGGTLVAALVLTLPPAASLALAAYKRDLASSLRRVPAIAALLTVAAMWAMPVSVGDEGSIKPRFAVPALLFAMASVVAPSPRAWRVVAALTLASLVAYKCNDERAVAARFNARAAVEMTLLRALPRHARVLPAAWWRRGDPEEKLFVHFTDLAVIERDAYVPDLFDAPGQQILRYRTMRTRLTARAPDELSLDELRGYDYVWARGDTRDAIASRGRGNVHPIRATERSVIYRAASGAFAR